VWWGKDAEKKKKIINVISKKEMTAFQQIYMYSIDVV